MLDFYERLAIKIKALEPALSISAGVLFIGFFFAFGILPEGIFPKKILFTVGLIMIWMCGIAMLGHMFAPQRDREGNQWLSRVRRSGGFQQGYAIIFVSVWFIGLFFITVVFVRKLVG